MFLKQETRCDSACDSFYIWMVVSSTNDVIFSLQLVAIKGGRE